jgi:hypothetical protein
VDTGFPKKIMRHQQCMIRKSGYRFSEKDHAPLKMRDPEKWMGKVIPL